MGLKNSESDNNLLGFQRQTPSKKFGEIPRMLPSFSVAELNHNILNKSPLNPKR